AHEGLAASEGICAGRVPESIPLRLDDLEFEVRLAEAQKTGLYLDQRFNRRAVVPLAEGRTVLDAFCNTGGVAPLPLQGGAAPPPGLASPPLCVQGAGEAGERTLSAGRWELGEENASAPPPGRDGGARRSGIVALDPPAFTKSAASLPGAVRGYKEINLRAMR